MNKDNKELVVLIAEVINKASDLIGKLQAITTENRERVCDDSDTIRKETLHGNRNHNCARNIALVNGEKHYSVPYASKLMDIPHSTLYHYASKGLVKLSRKRRPYLISGQEINEWLTQCLAFSTKGK